MAIDLIPGKKIFTQRDVRETANIAGTPAIADFTSAQHAHTGAASGGLVAHGSLSAIGTNTHAQVDTHIADATKHFTEASIHHGDILNIGTNTHAQIDTYIAAATVTSAVAGEGIDVSAATGAVTISCEDATSANKGIATFPTSDFTVAAGAVTIADERIADIVGGMVAGNTETGITVTYQDADNTLDFVVDSPTITYQTVVGTTDITTAGGGWADISQMTLTVAVAGTYLILGSITVYNDRAATTANNTAVRIINNAVHLVGGQSTQGDDHVAASQYDESQISLHTVVALAVNDVVKMQWDNNGGTSYNSASSSSTFRSRRLTIIRLA